MLKRFLKVMVGTLVVLGLEVGTVGGAVAWMAEGGWLAAFIALSSAITLSALVAREWIS